jgi:diadenosine tetraphosphate (Ap4A) HIT family hydrolase
MASARILLVLLAAVALPAAIDCDCDPARPETMKMRQCSLCGEAEKQNEGVPIFFLKDINPRKPNRWLALPRRHGSGQHHLHDLSPAERAALWTAAIGKAREMFGDEWGIAYNGEQVRTQCHTHLHVGKVLKGIETKNFIVVRNASEIPAPEGEGLRVHGAENGAMHVHLGEQITETALLR